MTDLKQLAAEALLLSEKATPGPWFHDEGNWDVESRHKEYFRSEICVSPGPQADDGFDSKDGDPYYDLGFVAFAREALPALAKGYLELESQDLYIAIQNYARRHLEMDAKLVKAVAALKEIQNAYGDPEAEDDVTMTARNCLEALGE